MNERIKNLIKKHGLSGVNSPKKTPSHPTKKGIVLAKEGDRYKLIRFGDQNMGHNYSPEARKSFKARHAQNIAKGKMSAAYWADKAFWGGPSADKKMPPKSQEYTRGLKKYHDGGKVANLITPNLDVVPLVWKAKPAPKEDAMAIRKLKAALAIASNLPYVGKMANALSVGADLGTGIGKYIRGDSAGSTKDFRQAYVNSLGFLKPGKLSNLSSTQKAYNAAIKTAKVEADYSDVKEAYKKYAEGGKVATKTNPSLWEKAKSQAKARMGGKHSARAMQLAVSIYKKAGGGYKGAKGETSLSKWTKQDWTTSSGKPSQGKRRYLPKAAWAALSSAQKAATNKAKAEGNKKGKQFVPQPKAIAKKTAQYR